MERGPMADWDGGGRWWGAETGMDERLRIGSEAGWEKGQI